MQVSNTMNTVGISSNAFLEIQLIIYSLNLSLDAKLSLTFDLLCWLGYNFVFVYAKITKPLTHSALVSILAGVSKHYAHVLIGNVGDGNFRPSFYKKQYLSNG